MCINTQYCHFLSDLSLYSRLQVNHLIRTHSNGFLLQLSNIPVYIYHSFLSHSIADEHLGCFCVLANVNSAAMNTVVHVSLSILVSSGCMPSSGVAGSYDSSISSFLSNLHAILRSSFTSFHSHNSVRGSPFLHTLSSI